MKTILCFLILVLCSCSSKLPDEMQVHVSSNIPAVIVVDDVPAYSETPALLRLSGNKEHSIVLLRAGYREASFKIANVPQRTRLMSTTFGDRIMPNFIFDEKDVDLCPPEPFDPFATSSCLSTTVPLAAATYLPSATTSTVTPYVGIEYEPQQVYINLLKNDSDAVSNFDIKRYVLKNFSNFDLDFQQEHLETITGLSRDEIKEILKANLTPDTAANAFSAAMEKNMK